MCSPYGKYFYFLILIIGLNVHAQENYKFEHITVNEGLAHSDAISVLQDKDGFIWIATNNGVDRYDGYELKNYLLPNANLNGLYNNRISDIHIGNDGSLWAAPEEQGVFFYDVTSDSFQSIAEKTRDTALQKLLRSISPRTLSTDKEGNLFIGTRTHGVLIVSFSSQSYIRKVQQIHFPKNGKDVQIAKVITDFSGNIWVGTSGLGLWHLHKVKDSFTPKFIHAWKPETASSLFARKDGTLWAGNSSKVARIIPDKSLQKVNIEWLRGSFANVNCLYEDSNRTLWIGTNFGLHRIQNLRKGNSDSLVYETRVFSVVGDNPNTLNSNRVHQLYEDSFNNLWIAASAGGLNKINLLAKPFAHLKRENYQPTKLPDNYINTIYKDTESANLWIGTRNGFSKYDLETKTYTNFLTNQIPGSLTNVSVSHFHDSGDGNLWVATRQNGIHILNKKNLSLRKLSDIPGQTPWSQIEPLAINEDKNGNIWIASFYAGIHVYSRSGNYLRTFNTGNSALPTNNLCYMFYDKAEDIMWVSTRNSGILKLRLKDENLTLLNRFSFDPNDPNGLKFNFTWTILKDKKGNIWVGTIGGGLHLIQHINGKDVITRYDKWLPETNVEAIEEGDNGEIWIGGRGLYRFNPENKTYLHYDVADGLQSNSFKVGASASDRKGTLFFGGINGISYFRPADVRSNPHPPIMQITRLRILGYEISPDQKNHPRAILPGPFSKNDRITIKDAENDFSIEFVGLNFHNPKKQRYAYKLEGYHQNWIPLLPGQRMAAFASLPAGDYTFTVKADNGDGLWAESPASLHLTILPPWFRTWWAYFLYTAVFLTALSWYRKTRERQRELKNKIALDQIEKEKQKELSDLKLNFFTNVSHELRTPLTLILNPAEELVKAVENQTEAKEKAVLVHKQAGKLLDLVNQLMDFRKIESGNMTLQLQNGDLVAFVTELFLIFKIKADEMNIRYTLNISPAEIQMNFDPAKMEIVLTNLLSNAFKYTPSGGSIELNIDFEKTSSKSIATDKNLRIVVKDSGMGIHPDDVSHVFEPFFQSLKNTGSKTRGSGIGLSLVRELVKIHKGEVEVKSRLGRGSEFTIKIPELKGETTSYFNAPTKENKLTQEVIASDLPPALKPSEFKLLIVEDNDDLRTYLTRLFSSYFEVSTAIHGLEGWEKIQQNCPDIVLSDVMMPELNGLELCEKIKNNPKTAHVPVVLITARAAALHELEGLESGADDYVVKPFNPKLLLSKLQSLLNNRRKVQEYYHRQILVEPSEAVIPDSDREFIQSAMKIVENNLTNEQFSVQSLVRESGMSQSAFYRKLKNITGQSVVEFIRDVRLKRAAQLLATGQFRVMEVMNKVGMEDYKYFRTAFQKLYHVSPSEYAKKKEEE